MIKKFALQVLGLVLAVTAFSACNDDPDPETEYILASTKVTAFSLQKNKAALNNLDTVFFSIDLVNAQIFNADSLPFGTDVRKIAVKISTEQCSAVELHVPRPGKSDTIVNYLTNSTDSINFSNGPVKLHVVSYDKSASRDYQIRLNVHKVKSDSLYWAQAAQTKLPGSFASPNAQKTVGASVGAVCLTSSNSSYSLSTNPNPAEVTDWITKTIDFPFTPDIRSLTGCNDRLYILSTDGELYYSDDLADSWIDTASSMYHIYGQYGDMILGVKKTGNTYYHVTYPPTSESIVDADCPVSETSATAYASTDWSNRQQCFFVGGRLADGSLSGATWGFDGSQWTMISSSLPLRAAGITMFNYEVCYTDTITWKSVEYPCLIAFGGRTSSTTLNRTVYLSRDNGINWKKADNLLQLPSYIPAMADADPLVFDRTLTDKKSGSGRNYNSSVFMKAVKPVTEWECPYIFIFGGNDDAAKLYNTIWIGVINRLTFKPII